jgi:hypothetical protein
MKTLKTLYLLISLCLLSSLSMLAQPGPGGGGDDTPTPLGGVVLLVAAGAALGAKQLYKKEKEQ